eukprot:CAMPEP_0197825178 /NCGR_PEP_ID=MMETSP1437-20131217/2306_1 /TAXON_ID=49252 ORGANISM="Eucampia antarctica, Strain CCMP1452" /NCGR_SAMPLE_ID=MMETSP1437 /ASSEMBLY_ACC=CAM_ASM_001096 /LENGTH=225 /DNA_ID=CAMNT_0043425073 /DNA_START=118 /DNA_END=795 /DNA_ORIENTATION=-
MNRVFGKKKAAAPAPSLDDASDGLGKRGEHMDSKIGALEKELKVYKDKMKATKSPAVKKNLQKRAMDVLKRKRMYEQQRDQMMSQQFNIEQASFGIESAKASVQTVAAMSAASQELKRTVRKDLNIDQIEDVNDDMAELMDEFNQINEALASNYATPEDIDEADLEAELEMLDDELEAIEETDSAVAEARPSYLQDPQLPAQPHTLPGNKHSTTVNGEQIPTTPY